MPIESSVDLKPVVFIGGSARSGTTAVHRVICGAANTNPYVSESWVLHALTRTYRNNMQRFDMEGRDQLGSIENLRTVVRVGFEKYIELVGRQFPQAELLVLKHPLMTAHFYDILRFFLPAKFIVVVRDPRDTIASLKRAIAKHEADEVDGPLRKFNTIEALCEHYRSYYRPVFKHTLRFGDKLLITRYEDFVTAPAAALESIEAFCGARFEGDEALRLSARDGDSPSLNRDLRMAAPKGSAFWSELYTKDLSSERVGRYAESLSPAEVATIERELSGIGNRFSYW